LLKILVLYHSRGGNTRKLAEKIVAGIEAQGAIAILKSTDEVVKDDFLVAAGIIAGSPVYFGGMAAELKKVFDDFVGLRKKMENKVGAAFATSGHHTGGKETTIMSIIHCMMIYGMIVVGDPLHASGHYGVACLGEPDAGAADDAEKLGYRVAELATRIGRE